MMLSRIGGHDKEDSSRDSYNGQLLRDIKEISKALYLHKAPPKALISPTQDRSKSAGRTRVSDSKPNPNPRTPNDNMLQKDKKSPSVWNWKKPLKALAHLRQHRFNICFILHVHSIEGLPSNFEGSSLVVQWKRKDEVLSTRPSRVSDGIAEFEETLMHRCSVYGSRSGPHNSAKYEVKLFFICASVVGSTRLDLGKHWIDLTRLLPLSLDELEGGKSTGKWTTSFKLSGLANGAALSVSFGYSVIRDSFVNSHGKANAASDSNNSSAMLRRVGSVPSNLDIRSSQPDEVKSFHQVSPILTLELSKSIDFLYQKLNERNLQTSEGISMLSDHEEKPMSDPFFESDNQSNECDDIYFALIEKGIEECKQEEPEMKGSAVPSMESSTIEIIDVNEILTGEDTTFNKETEFIDQFFMDEPRNEESSVSSKESFVGESESAFSSQVISESFDVESSSAMDGILEQENFVKSSYKTMKKSKKSLSLDDITDSVASDFLNMLGLDDCSYAFTSDTEPESPRERLLREFEKEALASGSFLLDFDEKMECGSDPSDYDEYHEEFSFSSTIHDPEDHNKHEGTSQLLISRRKAKVLEDLETESLMREWGLNDNVFKNSPRVRSDGFGSPIELPLEGPIELPPLGDGFGPFVQTKSGGYIQSVNPLLFRHSKNATNLTMQVSVPVVLPLELGFDVIEILQNMASIGVQKLSSLVNASMPLEDITGKAIQQVAESSVARRLVLDCSNEGQAIYNHESSHQLDSFPSREVFVGLPSNELTSKPVCDDMLSGYISLEALVPLAVDRIESLSVEGLRIQCAMSDQEAPSSLSPNPINNPSNVLELIGFSLTLDDWLKLDTGITGDEDQINEHTLKVLAAHHFNRDRAACGEHRFLGDKLTVAFMVLLRDPLRNYEPVGTSMLALIQVERASLSLNANTCNTVLERSEEENSEVGARLWRITEVHLAGLKTEPGSDRSWGTRTQQQSGTRWLLASGIGKTNKRSSSNSKAIIIVSNPEADKKAENTFWSITSETHERETKWKKMAASLPITRNPDVTFPNGRV